MRSFIPLAILFMVVACGNPEKEETTTKDVTDSKTEEIDTRVLAQQYCGSCHGWTKESDNRIAPVLKEIQSFYSEAYPDKKERMRRLVSFVQKPESEKAIMKESVALYALMPQMPVPTPELMAISELIIEADFDEIELQSKEKNKLSEAEKQLLEQGKSYALATKAVLGKNLMMKLKSEGTEGALEFCNLKAIHFTDSMSLHQGVTISRVSDQNRNPENEAAGEALKFIKRSKELLMNGKTIKPEISTKDGKATGFYPILTNAMCLQCHGKSRDEIRPSTLALIEDLYPEDRATGYGLNELRGIWVVEWPIEEN